MKKFPVGGLLRTECQSQGAAPSVYCGAWVLGMPRLAAFGRGVVIQAADVGEVPGTRGWTWPVRQHSRKLLFFFFSQAIKKWKLVSICDELKCES